MEHFEEIMQAEATEELLLIPPSQGKEDVFIAANTVSCTLAEVKEKHIIPVFARDNEPAISHTDFIEVMQNVVADIFEGEHILRPVIRLSHPIKGRIPEAKNKSAIELLERERTLYYERMMFAIEIPSIQDTIDGNTLSLTVGGVKAYNLDNLYAKKGTDEHFKIFIGFKNRVCTNLCIWTDGFMGDIRATSVGHLKAFIKDLVMGYNSKFHLFNLKQLVNCSITEKQFATLIGRAKMYQYLSVSQKKAIPQLFLGENQIALVCKDYFRDIFFSSGGNGDLSLWKLYNLFTGVNKSTYIDSFLDRSANAFHFVEQIRFALEDKQTSWYLN